MASSSQQLDDIVKDIKDNTSIFTIPTVYSSMYFPELVEKRLEDYYKFLADYNIGKRLNSIFRNVEQQDSSKCNPPKNRTVRKARFSNLI